MPILHPPLSPSLLLSPPPPPPSPLPLPSLILLPTPLLLPPPTSLLLLLPCIGDRSAADSGRGHRAATFVVDWAIANTLYRFFGNSIVEYYIQHGYTVFILFYGTVS